eukprot:23008-Rhodomonas_salina.1
MRRWWSRGVVECGNTVVGKRGISTAAIAHRDKDSGDRPDFKFESPIPRISPCQCSDTDDTITKIRLAYLRWRKVWGGSSESLATQFRSANPARSGCEDSGSELCNHDTGYHPGTVSLPVSLTRTRRRRPMIKSGRLHWQLEACRESRLLLATSISLRDVAADLVPRAPRSRQEQDYVWRFLPSALELAGCESKWDCIIAAPRSKKGWGTPRRRKPRTSG